MNEKQLEQRFFGQIIKILNHTIEVNEGTDQGEFPDHAFFPDSASRDDAHKKKGNSFYNNAIAIGEVKRWGIELDRFGKDKKDRIFFTTPPDRHAALVEQAKALYSNDPAFKCVDFVGAPGADNLDRINRIDRNVYLFYREIEYNNKNYHMCVVTNKSEGFIITAYKKDRIKEGVQIWKKLK